MAKSTASSIKEVVRVTLRGPDDVPKLSAQSKARFNKYAVKDAESGEPYLGPEEFIAAIVPPDEDYVCPLPPTYPSPSACNPRC